MRAHPGKKNSWRRRKGLALAIALALLSPCAAVAQDTPNCGNGTGIEFYDEFAETLYCSADQSPGIFTLARNLVVDGIASDITPAAGLAGIQFFGAESGTLVSDLGDAKIVTTGDFANGIDAIRDDGVIVTHSGDITAKGDGSIGINASALMGDVAVTSRANIAIGNSGFGISAKSGSFSVSVRSMGDIRGGELSTGILAQIESDIDDGDVAVVSQGDITLLGPDPNSLFDTAGIAAFGFDKVSVVSKGNIVTSGSGSPGIYARTQDGDVSVASAGNISTSGFMASSILVSGNGENTVEIESGTLQTKAADVINFENNVDGSNALTNRGIIIAPDTWNAVSSGGEVQTKIDNYGTISGAVYLLPVTGPVIGQHTFNNHEGAVFNPKDIVELGDTGIMTNSGKLSPGGDGKVNAVALGGNLTQSATGALAIDIDLANGKADRIEIVGTAALSGRVVPNLLSFGSFKQPITIITAHGGVTLQGLIIDDSGFIDYSILYPNGTDVALGITLTFDIGGLTDEQNAVLDYLERTFNADLPDSFLPLINALLAAPDDRSVAAIMGQFVNDAPGATILTTMNFGDAMAAALRSCPVADGDHAELRETSCLWAKPQYRQFSQERSADRARISDNKSGISGGLQVALGQNVWGGLGVSLEESNTGIDGTTKVEGSWWQAGGMLKWAEGPWKVSASISGGNGDLETSRHVNIPGLTATATSTSDTTFASGLLRVAYSFGGTAFYVTPMLNAGFTAIDSDGFTETGAGVLNLDVAGQRETIYSGGPAIEIGSTITTEGLTLRPYVRAGVTLLSEDTIETNLRLAEAPRGLGGFGTATNFDDIYADISAGVQLFSTSGVNLRFNYDGRIGETSEQHGFDAKLTINY